jgi:hypothetical protein
MSLAGFEPTIPASERPQTSLPLGSARYAYVLRTSILTVNLMFVVQIAPETCRANDERNKEYTVHLFGPELNIYI